MARLDELERKFEENPRRYFAPLANEYRKAGDALRAVELCRAQLPEVPGHISGYIVLGQSLYDAADYPGSRSALETALALDPENIVALRYLGDIARDTGDSAEAERWYSRTLEADPYNEAATAALQSLRESAPSAIETQRDDVQPPTASEIDAPFEIDAPSESVSVLTTDSFAPDVEPATHAADAAPSEMVLSEEGPDQPEFAGDLEISAAPDAIDASAEPVTQPEPSGAGEPSETEEGVMAAAAPFVTETMADLYLEQGYPHEALELLLQLSEQRPGDESLRVKIEQIESVIVARRDAAVAAARAERAETTESAAPPDAPLDAAVAEVDASAFVESPAIVALTENSVAEATGPAVQEIGSDESISVRELFARMATARPRHSEAETPRPLSQLRSDFMPMPDVGPDFQPRPSADPFAFPNPPAHAEEPTDGVRRTSGPHPTFNPSTARIEDFDAWLRGLRGP